MALPNRLTHQTPCPPCPACTVNNTRLELQSSGNGGNATVSQPSSSSSSLSSGAIAGIAVGAAVVALVAAAGGWALLRLRQQRHRTGSGDVSAGDEGGKADKGSGAVEQLPSWGSSLHTPAGSARGDSSGAATATGGSGAAAQPLSGGSACHVERNFQLRPSTAASPFAIMASRAASGAVGTGSSPPMPASPFLSAGNSHAQDTPLTISHQSGIVARSNVLGGISSHSGASGPPSGTFHSPGELSGGLASLAAIPAAAAARSGGSSTGTPSGSGSVSRILPELEAHVAAVSSLVCWLAGLLPAGGAVASHWARHMVCCVPARQRGVATLR